MKPRSTVMEIFFHPNFLNGQYSVEICRVLRHRYVLIVGDNAPAHGWPYPHGKAVEVPLNQLHLALQSLSPSAAPPYSPQRRQTVWGRTTPQPLQMSSSWLEGGGQPLRRDEANAVAGRPGRSGTRFDTSSSFLFLCGWRAISHEQICDVVDRYTRPSPTLNPRSRCALRMTQSSLTYRGAFRALSATCDSWQFWVMGTGLDEIASFRMRRASARTMCARVTAVSKIGRNARRDPYTGPPCVS